MKKRIVTILSVVSVCLFMATSCVSVSKTVAIEDHPGKPFVKTPVNDSIENPPRAYYMHMFKKDYLVFITPDNKFKIVKIGSDEG